MAGKSSLGRLRVPSFTIATPSNGDGEADHPPCPAPQLAIGAPPCPGFLRDRYVNEIESGGDVIVCASVDNANRGYFFWGPGRGFVAR